MDLYSIIKDAVSAGASAVKEHRDRQRILLDKLFEIDAELYNCALFVEQERERLISRLNSLNNQDANEMRAATQAINETLSVQGRNIGRLLDQVKSFIEILQTNTIYDYSALDPAISQWSRTIFTIKDCVSGIVRQFDQVIDDAH